MALYVIVIAACYHHVKMYMRVLCMHACLQWLILLHSQAENLMCVSAATYT